MGSWRPKSPLKLGPMVEVPSSEWQVLHCLPVYMSFPTSAGGRACFVPSAAVTVVPSSSTWSRYLSASSTMTFDSMFECDCPQNSAQNTLDSPVCVAVNHSVAYRPGSTSCLMRKSGMKNEWMTSCDCMMSFTGLFTGTYSLSLMTPFLYWNSQAHLRPRTWISSAFAGATRPEMYSFTPQWKSPMQTRSGPMDQKSSIHTAWSGGWESCSSWNAFLRYLKTQ